MQSFHLKRCKRHKANVFILRKCCIMHQHQQIKSTNATLLAQKKDRNLNKFLLFFFYCRWVFFLFLLLKFCCRFSFILFVVLHTKMSGEHTGQKAKKKRKQKKKEKKKHTETDLNARQSLCFVLSVRSC